MRRHRAKRSPGFRLLLFSTILLLPAAVLICWTFLRSRHQDSEHAKAAAVRPMPANSDSHQRLWGVAGLSLLAADPSKSQPIVYPYSVVAGGVRDTKELRSEMAKDPVVASHYSDFNVSRSRIIELKSEKLAFVSYRIGNDVFWTRKKLRLARGEKLITDGVNSARTRCGNRISEAPHLETSPAEPSSEVLDTPLQAFTATPTPGPLAGASSSSPPVLEPPIIVVPGGSPDRALVPPIIVVPGGSPDGPSVPGPTPTPVPEPSTLLLVSSGVAYLLYRKSLKK